jgi:hypothetical protein
LAALQPLLRAPRARAGRKARTRLRVDSLPLMAAAMRDPRSAVAVCLYRSLLQWTRAHARGPPFVVSSAEVLGAWRRAACVRRACGKGSLVAPACAVRLALCADAHTPVAQRRAARAWRLAQ